MIDPLTRAKADKTYWNYLPAEIKMCKSINSFKSKLKCFLIDKY